MASVKMGDFIVDIVIHNIDGMFHKILDIPFDKGFWIFLTVQNSNGQKESFPAIDHNFKVKIYSSYADAIDDVSSLLKKYIS